MCITIIENADKQLQSGELGILKLGKSERYIQICTVGKCGPKYTNFATDTLVDIHSVTGQQYSLTAGKQNGRKPLTWAHAPYFLEKRSLCVAAKIVNPVSLLIKEAHQWDSNRGLVLSWRRLKSKFICTCGIARTKQEQLLSW